MIEYYWFWNSGIIKGIDLRKLLSLPHQGHVLWRLIIASGKWQVWTTIKEQCRGWQTAWELQGSIWGVLRAGKRQVWTTIKGQCRGWQTAALNTYKKPLMRPEGRCPWAIAVALWWVLRAGVARVGLVGVLCSCGAMRTFGTFGGFWRVWGLANGSLERL